MSRTRVEVRIGGKLVKNLDLPDDGLVIGSDADAADLAISDPTLAPRHVRLRGHDDGLVLVTPLADAPLRVGREVVEVESFVRVGHRLRLSDAVEIGLVEAPSKAKKGPGRKSFFPRFSTARKVGFGIYFTVLAAIAVFFATTESVETFEPGATWAEANVLTDAELANCRGVARRGGDESVEKTIAQTIRRALGAERTGALPDAVREYERVLALGLAPTECKAIRYAADRRSQLLVITKKTRVVQ